MSSTTFLKKFHLTYIAILFILRIGTFKIERKRPMRVWVEKPGVFADFVDVAVGSAIRKCLEKASIVCNHGDRLELNGLDTDPLTGKKITLDTVVKENDYIMVIPAYSGGSSFFLESFLPSLE